EVYVVATMTIGLVTWIVVRWRERLGEPGADRLLLAVALLMGLSTGAHLMALLCLPAAGVLVATVLWRSRRDFVLGLAALAAGGYLVVLKAFDADAWIAGSGGVLKPVPFVLGLLLVGAALVLLRRARALAFAGLAVLLFAAGTSVFLYLKIRAGLDPVINEADPSTWKSLVEVLLRRQYDVRPPFPRTVDFVRVQVPLYLDYLFGAIGPFRSAVSSQFGGPGVLGGVITLAWVALAAFGAVEHARTDRPTFVYVLLVWLVTGLGLVVWLNFRAGFTQAPELPDLPREVRERDYFFIVSYATIGLWTGMGAFALLVRAALRSADARRLAPAAAGLALLVPAITFARNFHEADRSGNTTARDFAFNVLESAEPFAVVFTNGDNDTFPLWYLQEVEGIRRDVAVANLSLLNTTWYLEQLGRRPFTATPPAPPIRTAAGGVTQPDSLPSAPVLTGGADLPPLIALEEAREVAITAPSGRQVWVRLPPGYLRRQDMAVLRLLGEQLGRRPVYFSVTVPTSALVGTQPYLTREGILYRVHDQPGVDLAASDERMMEVPHRPGLVFDVPRTDRLIWRVYRYAGLLDDDVFKDTTTRALARNYGYTLLAMSEIYYARDEPRRARRAFELAQAFLGNPALESDGGGNPDAAERVRGFYANAVKLMAAAGDTLAIDSLLGDPAAEGMLDRPTLESAALLAALRERYSAARAIAERDVPRATREEVDRTLWVRLGDVALENGDSLAAENFYAASLRGDRDFRLGYLKLVSTAGERGQLPTAIAAVENWVTNHPRDTLSRRLLEEMRSTQRFPDELRWENLEQYFPGETLPAFPETAP
ncbi:MAG TPA: DUF2723 domain-containing protein, partial [Gemmatimonadota bacterium]